MKIYYNALPFNILMLAGNTFLIWFFSKAGHLRQVQKILVWVAVFFALFGIINLFFFQGFSAYNSFSESLADIILSIICCYLLFKLVKDEGSIDLLKLDYFWLATGVLFYSLGSALFYHFSYLLHDFNKETNIDICTYIIYALNLPLYISLIIAFICRRKTTR